ncbi:hypothetical protein H5200_22885 [Pseudoalteromonas sp. SG43-7]|uniref:hypothetical protein n=2 Tax=Pseudoalteromonas TaxID=53246 RepID=UPI0015FEED93|nr:MULTISPECIES: hypothetical protein [unclassified Pseudoalteromonas]MBB1336027.1 hypothetical protein [Pseudoalteromonas sp. SR41-6]MBB1344325.1 hypothetical protein [Pseudoalteromonas sp. SR45-6]MBB1424719.1 hypothetical protein [Pseudoalteromonas sp. SG43-7]MBB1461596.1 hypothetical protein [Pseudoalteromonas sp. SG41-8]
MSSLIHLSLIDEDRYPTSLDGDDESKYQQLLDITQKEAIHWQSIEINLRGFEPALQLWDAIAGNSRLLLIASFNFYPHKLLPPDADISGSFGFFPADMVKDLYAIMEEEYNFDISNLEGQQIIAEIEKDGDDEVNPEAYELVRDKYFVTFRDAAEQGKSIVVLIEQ